MDNVENNQFRYEYPYQKKATKILVAFFNEIYAVIKHIINIFTLLLVN